MYDFWLFVHLGGLLLFVAGHGASAVVGLRLRRERDRPRTAALLDASGATRGATYAGMLLLGTGGLVDAFLGHWWSAGWVWTSIILFMVMAAVLVALAIPYYRRLRLAVAGEESGGTGDELAALTASAVPSVILVVGAAGLGILLWLMVFKPF